MKRIFISGPYSLGDIAVNVKKSMDVANELINLGYAPFCPHLTHFLHMNNYQEYEKWLAIDIKYLEVCDALLRIPGISKGADLEVQFATRNQIPVFFSINDLNNFFS